MKKFNLPTYFLFVCTYVLLQPLSFAQSNTNEQKYTNYIKNRAYSILSKLEYTTVKELKEISDVSIVEYYPDGAPKKAKMSFVMGNKLRNNWTRTDNFTITVVFKEGLPFAISGDRYLRIPYRAFPTEYNSKDEISKNLNEDFSPQEKSKITQLFNAFQYDILNSNTSYLAVLKRHSQYSGQTDIKNNLGVLYLKKETYQIVWNDNPDFGSIPYATEKNPDVVSAGLKDFKYYKNISNHNIILKGIRQEYHTADSYNYVDVSVELKPGEVYPFFEINKSFNPKNVYNNVQFIGDVGVVKKLSDKDYLRKR